MFSTNIFVPNVVWCCLFKCCKRLTLWDTNLSGIGATGRPAGQHSMSIALRWSHRVWGILNGFNQMLNLFHMIRLLKCGLGWDLPSSDPESMMNQPFRLASEWLRTWPSTSVATSRLSAFLSGCHLRQLNLSLVHTIAKNGKLNNICEVVRRPNRQECQYPMRSRFFPVFLACVDPLLLEFPLSQNSQSNTVQLSPKSQSVQN